jgi:spermidine/putrescine-binding protein
MNRFIPLIVAACFAWSAQAAETGAVTEAFACNLKPGKTMADFDKATDFWSTQMDKIPSGDEQFVVLLTPLRASTPVDVFWLGTDANLNAWAKGEAAYEASAEGRAAEANFDKVITCDSGLWFTQSLHEGLPMPKPGDTSIVEAYQCTLNQGKTMANVEHAHAMWAAYVESQQASDPEVGKFSAYVMVPWLDSVPFDLGYLVVDDNLQDFGKLNTAAMTTGAGRAVQAAFDEAMSCDGGLYTGKVVRVPATPPQ